MRNISTRCLGIITVLATLICLVLPTQMISAQDMPVPHLFYGNLLHSDGSPASAGVVVSATVGGEDAGSIISTQAGMYGNEASGYPKLKVYGNFIDGDEIQFYVNGIPASPTCEFDSGSVTELDLTYTPPAQYFYGSVKQSDGADAPSGVRISAHINGIEYGSIITSQAGQYSNLKVQDDIEDGATVQFYVNDVLATPTAIFTKDQTTEVNLTYTPPYTPPATTPSGGNGGGGGIGYETGKTINIKVVEVEFKGKISDSGFVSNGFTVSSSDLDFIVPSGTRILLNGVPPEEIKITPSSTVYKPEAGNLVVAFDCEPSGVEFNPFVSLVWHYDDENLPTGLTTETLENGDVVVKVYFINDQGESIEVPCTLNLETRTVTAAIDHFSAYAFVAVPLSPTTPTSPPTSPIQPTSPASSVPASTTTTSPTYPPTSSATLSTTSAPTNSSTPPPSRTLNWGMIILIVSAGVVIVALVTILIAKKGKIG